MSCKVTNFEFCIELSATLSAWIVNVGLTKQVVFVASLINVSVQCPCYFAVHWRIIYNLF